MQLDILLITWHNNKSWGNVILILSGLKKKDKLLSVQQLHKTIK